MNIKVFLLLLGTILLTKSYSQINTFFVEPIVTEANYVAAQDSHLVVRNTSTNINKLFLYIGGTGSETNDYKLISEFAGKQGFDVINISYPNDVAAASLKSSTDILAFDTYRQEICYGTNLSSAVTVDSLNSISTRTVHLINYLHATYPSQNWNQYLSSSNTLDWTKIAVGGHSQGSGHAAYFGKHETPERIIMLSGLNDYSDHFSQPANWVRIAGKTPVNKHFVYLSLLDDVVPFAKQFSNITDLGMYPATDTVHVDEVSEPFNNSHCLYTTQGPGLTLLKHNSTVKFSFLNNSVWEYMLTSDVLTSTQPTIKSSSFNIYPNPSNNQLNVKSEVANLGEPYSILNATGQVIQIGKLNSRLTQINLSNLDKGTFFLFVNNQAKLFLKN